VVHAGCYQCRRITTTGRLGAAAYASLELPMTLDVLHLERMKESRGCSDGSRSSSSSARTTAAAESSTAATKHCEPAAAKRFSNQGRRYARRKHARACAAGYAPRRGCAAASSCKDGRRRVGTAFSERAPQEAELAGGPTCGRGAPSRARPSQAAVLPRRPCSHRCCAAAGRAQVASRGERAGCLAQVAASLYARPCDTPP